MDRVIKLDNVDHYNSLYGLETLHPLVSVVDLTKATKSVNHLQMTYGLYALFLKGAKNCDIKYGRQHYDYQEGTIVCFAPGQTAGVEMLNDVVQQEVYGILFHPDLIRGTSLGKTIKDYTFFSYCPEEALHLSLREKQIILEFLERIRQELERCIDRHSKKIISKYIELLLDYCTRFYERQFITRSEVNKKVFREFNHLLDNHFNVKVSLSTDVLSDEYCANLLHLSPAYFNDLLKYEIGKEFKEYIQFKRFEIAKGWLVNTDKTLGQIAQELGFSNSQYFSRLFKKITGCSPNEFRMPN